MACIEKIDKKDSQNSGHVRWDKKRIRSMGEVLTDLAAMICRPTKSTAETKKLLTNLERHM